MEKKAKTERDEMHECIYEIATGMRDIIYKEAVDRLGKLTPSEVADIQSRGKGGTYWRLARVVVCSLDLDDIATCQYGAASTVGDVKKVKRLVKNRP